LGKRIAESRRKRKIHHKGTKNTKKTPSRKKETLPSIPLGVFFVFFVPLW